jgi:hypothetical protein
MPEPDNFTPIEQYQDVNKRIWNELVREYFRDVKALETNLDLSIPRHALLKACLHREDDSLLLTIGRMHLFLYGTTWLRDQYPIVAGSLLSEVDEAITYRPKITLFFCEDAEDAEAGYQPVEMETSWRLFDETNKTITETKLKTIANQIKTRFGTNSGYIFKKGRKIIRYRQLAQGYDFKLRARSLADGKDLIREILSLNGHSLDAEILKISAVDAETDAFPYNPGFQTILGKRKPNPRRRPLVNVRFRHAYATIHGYRKPVYLYSRSNRIPDTLVK